MKFIQTQHVPISQYNNKIKYKKKTDSLAENLGAETLLIWFQLELLSLQKYKINSSSKNIILEEKKLKSVELPMNHVTNTNRISRKTL